MKPKSQGSNRIYNPHMMKRNNKTQLSFLNQINRDSRQIQNLINGSDSNQIAINSYSRGKKQNSDIVD